MRWLSAVYVVIGALSGAATRSGVGACTVIAISGNATADGSTLIAHTDDAGGGAADVRLVRVPAQDHEAGAQRLVFNFFGGYPRLVTKERGRHYFPREDIDEPVMKPLGYIPQVPRTYAYFDQDYGMMNEVQLSIGESTCGAKTVGWPYDAGTHGKNLFGIAELSKVALERCDSARCAVKTMGDLAVEYGFYSEDSGDPQKPDYGDSAEALVIGDKYGEMWVFHVLTGKDNSSAVWAAQRVPDGHVTALANGFTIREMDLDDSDWYMASPNVVSFAEEMGWWDSSKPFDFTAAYGDSEKDAVGPLYTGRRIWRVYDVLAPSLKLDARLGSFSQYATYPFSVKPDELVELNTVMELLRDHYEGTKYDMTKGIAAGPFGSPVRWGGNTQGVLGGWERPISMYRTMFSFVLQVRGSLPDAIGGVAWYAQSAPHGSVYVPFSCRQEEIPESYLLGKQSEFHPKSAWWAFNFVNNWSLLRFNAINQEVRKEIGILQSEAFITRAQMEKHALANLAHDSKLLNEYIEKQSNDQATHVVDHWWQFAWLLVAKFSDGYVTTGEQPRQMQAPGYPAWWLQLSEFSKWPGDTFMPRKSVRGHLTWVGNMNSLRGHSSPSFGMWPTLGLILSGFVLGAGVLAFIQRRKRGGYDALE
uniref:Dipeptidase n=1 Tax=Globisporangium ultimum (strain ATCC 200006 / CBS 805.95 / DAOM BR144) TaxID=431595 RepID=K3W943_GLOUD